jgi:hypothetical protein
MLTKLDLLLYCSLACGAVTITGPTTCQQNTTCTYVASGGTGPYVYTLAAGSSGSISPSTGVYTAPSSITPAQTFGGVQIHPNNHIFNTRVDGSVPVNSNNATWWANINHNRISYEPGFYGNVGAVSGDTTQTLAFYYTPQSDGTFHLSSLGRNLVDRLESGSISYDITGTDRHFIKVFKDGTPVEEIYKPYPLGYFTPGGVTNACPGASPAHQCSGQSGVKYDPASLALGVTGTDAANMELLPLSIRVSELKAGPIGHAVRITLDAASENKGLNIWPAQGNNGTLGSCNGTPTNCPPYGARFRMKSSYTFPGFDSICSTANCQTYVNRLIAQLKSHGGIVSDIGSASAMSILVDDYLDPDVVNAFFEFMSVQIPFNSTNFEWLDESSLNTNQAQGAGSLTWGEAKWNNSAGQAVSGFAVVIATDSLSAVGNFSISLQAVTVGVPRPTEPIQAGTGTFQLTGWATGASNTNVTWSVTGGCGTSITSGGLFTVPSSVGGRTECIATATSVADNAKTATVNLVILPTGLLRINVGDTADYTDGAGNVWFADALAGHPPLFDNGKGLNIHNAWTNAGAFPNVFNNQVYSGGFGDEYYHLVVPNGTYTLTFWFGNSATATLQQQAQIDSQGNVNVANLDPYTASGNTQYQAYSQTVSGVSVSNNVLSFNIRNVGVSCGTNSDFSANLCAQPSTLGANPLMLGGFTVQQSVTTSGTSIVGSVVVSGATVIR